MTGPRRILIVPLSNVLGHLTRGLALAEAFDARGDEVHLVLARAPALVKKALPPRIRILPAPEMPVPRIGRRGLLATHDSGEAADRANLEREGRLGPSERGLRAARLKEMAERDKAIVGLVRPDAVITDWRFTPALLGAVAPERLFHVSSLVGYASFFRRRDGKLPYPLETGHLLVPGIAAIEREAEDAGSPRESLCGPFRWRGWSRLGGSAERPPASDLFACFGSTGRGQQVLPWLARTLPARYRLAAIGAGSATPGALGPFLAATSVALCHGGHGTVMECLLHGRPMIVFPQTIEQLEIGRRIERLGLGLVAPHRFERLSEREVGDMIDRLMGDPAMARRLDHVSALLAAGDGADRAAAIVHEKVTAASR